MEHSPHGAEGVLSPSDSASSGPHHEAETSVNFSDVSSTSSFSTMAMKAAVAAAATASLAAIGYSHVKRSASPTRECRRQIRRIHRLESSRGPHNITSFECEEVADEKHKCSRRPPFTSSRAMSGAPTGLPSTTAGHFCNPDAVQISENISPLSSCTEILRGNRCHRHYNGMQSAPPPQNAPTCRSYARSVPGNMVCRCCRSFGRCSTTPMAQNQPYPAHTHITCCPAHEWHCNPRKPQIATRAVNAVWMDPRDQRTNSGYSIDVCAGTARHSEETLWHADNCCGQRLRRGGYATPSLTSSTHCRKKQPHTADVSSYDCHNCLSAQAHNFKSVKSLKAPKPRPKEQKVQARRIRHPPCDDSNSESELNGPVIDVRAMRSTASRLSAISIPAGQARPYSNSKTFQTISTTMPPTPSGPTKVYSCPGLYQIQASPCTMSNANNINIYARESPSSSGPRKPVKCVPQQSSSSSESDARATDSTSCTSPYTESSSSSGAPQRARQTDANHAHHATNAYIYPCQVDPSASTSHACQHHAAHVPNAPMHPYCNSHLTSQYAVNTNSTAMPGMPISSGDFLNVRRAWPRSRSQQQTSKCGRRPDMACYGARKAWDTDGYGHETHRIDWRWLSQTLTNPNAHAGWGVPGGYS